MGLRFARMASSTKMRISSWQSVGIGLCHLIHVRILASKLASAFLDEEKHTLSRFAK